ncbi:hypothetical protein FKM82_024369 [Ascaphus truei]
MVAGLKYFGQCIELNDPYKYRRRWITRPSGRDVIPRHNFNQQSWMIQYGLSISRVSVKIYNLRTSRGSKINPRETVSLFKMFVAVVIIS